MFPPTPHWHRPHHRRPATRIRAELIAPDRIDRLRLRSRRIIFGCRIAAQIQPLKPARPVPPELIGEVVESRINLRRIGERHRAGTVPGFAEHAPVIEGVPHGLIAIGIARAELRPLQETFVAEIIGRVAAERAEGVRSAPRYDPAV